MRPGSSARSQRVDAFAGVLEHVGQRLGDEPAVEFGPDRLGRQFVLERDVGAADAGEEQGLAHAIGEIVARQPGPRHAGEIGELVDHALDVVDLPDDRVRALVEDVLALDDVAAVAAFQPLGGELDRGQRVLDLVRDAARDVGPGGARCAVTNSVMSSSVMTRPSSGCCGSPVTRMLSSRSRPPTLQRRLRLMHARPSPRLGQDRRRARGTSPRRVDP